MKVVVSASELNQLAHVYRSQKLTIGFVPTMGALHAGHISLIAAAKAACDVVIASIFVNPTQFNDSNDLKNYPRTLENDCSMLTEAGCDVVFVPEVAEMYSDNELSLKKQHIEDLSWMDGKLVDFGTLATVMEGAQRPGHFNGVAQVVSKLFKIVMPHSAFFGQKDFQQLAIVRSMAKQLAMPIHIIACPIIREPNGLAMSSRNERLATEEKAIAGEISKTLFTIRNNKNVKSIADLKKEGAEHISSIATITLEYLEIVNTETLQTITNLNETKQAVACIAVRLGTVRLIDNLLL
jgi:pantoate--beta-alanine ligase